MTIRESLDQPTWGFRAYLDINCGYVSDDIKMAIYHRNGRDSLVVHELQSFTERFITTT